MNSKILVIDCTSGNKLHFMEFVQPILDAIPNKTKAIVVHYPKLSEKHIKNSDAIILTGTSLADNAFLKHAQKFGFLRNCEKPVLGICAGMQIIAKVFGAKIEVSKSPEIGNIKIRILKDDLLFAGLGKELPGTESSKNEFTAYCLHNNSATLPKNFELFASSQQCKVQAFRHKSKQIYGVEFHPEVGDKKVLRNWLATLH